MNIKLIEEMPLHRVPKDVLVRICGYLWFQDYLAFLSTSHYYQSLETNLKAYIFEKYLRMALSQSQNLAVDASVSILPKDILNLCKRVAVWPSTVDTQALQHSHGPDDLLCYDSSLVRIRFVGSRLGRDRAIVSNCHFPCCLSDSSRLVDSNIQTLPGTTLRQHRPLKADDLNIFSIAYSNAPFTKVVHQKSSPTPLITFSCVAYFECTILSHTSRHPHSWTPCVSIGLSCPSFPLRRKQPGWDRCSFGYHGDDGNFFHGDGMGEPMGPSFGVGDTVGCMPCSVQFNRIAA